MGLYATILFLGTDNLFSIHLDKITNFWENFYIVI